ncbi:MAG: type IV pilus assembly protein PilO, partial [Phenylobacterium sp.]
MNFKIDLAELDLNNLDFENVGGWPKPVKMIFAVLAFIIASVATYFVFVDAKITDLNNAEAEEQRL